LEPNALYVHGWHIDFICEHLEAIMDGRLAPRLLINVPPGTMKSLLVSVFWPAWEWGPRGLASLRYLTTSYSESYVKRDARRMRDLINSEWYQGLWPLQLVREAEISFENAARGYREGRPFSGLTGGRGDRLIVDDPHSTETAESEADRTRTTRTFRESVPLRLNDPVKSAIVIIMQRLHANDVSGVALALKLGYVHIMLPMEFESERRCVTPIGQDPRVEDGELLLPDRFTPETVERDKVPLGSYGVAGQFQQRPAPREGGLFKRAWFGEPIAAAPAGTRWVRHWDLAASKSRGALGISRVTRFIYIKSIAPRGPTLRSTRSTPGQEAPPPWACLIRLRMGGLKMTGWRSMSSFPSTTWTCSSWRQGKRGLSSRSSIC
jgi:hypothetical protein